MNSEYTFGFHANPNTTFDGNYLFITAYDENHIPTHIITKSHDGIFYLYAVTTYTGDFTFANTGLISSVDAENKVWTLLNKIIEKAQVNEIIKLINEYVKE